MVLNAALAALDANPIPLTHFALCWSKNIFTTSLFALQYKIEEPVWSSVSQPSSFHNYLLKSFLEVETIDFKH